MGADEISSLLIELQAAPDDAELRRRADEALDAAGKLAMLKAGLPSCTNLVLTSNALGDEALEGLRRWKQLARVETLYLSACELSSEGLETLLAAPLPRLAKLCLSNNELEDSCADVFASHATNLPALAHLELKNIGLGMDGLSALAAAQLPALRRLDVRQNDLSPLQPADPRVRVSP